MVQIVLENPDGIISGYKRAGPYHEFSSVLNSDRFYKVSLGAVLIGE